MDHGEGNSRNHASQNIEETFELPPQMTNRKTTLLRRATQAPINEPVRYQSFLCGLLAGVAQAGVFNPYDRALYLSIKNDVKFLDISNWRNPYGGFFQSVGGRALSGGLYFPLEHLYLRMLDAEEINSKNNLIAGTAAGATNACILNPLSAVKYKTWGRDVTRPFYVEALSMLRQAGIRPFLNGLRPTMYRDIVFGGCYTWMRYQISVYLPPSQEWISKFVAAGLATILSGPFNYVRNIQYGVRSIERADTTIEILRKLMQENRECSTIPGRLLHMQTKLRIGWGTARVAIGMTFAHTVYDILHEKLYEL